MINFKRRTPRLSVITRLIYRYFIFIIVGFALIVYFVTKHKQNKYSSEYRELKSLYVKANIQKTIAFANTLLESYDKNSIEGLSIIMIRGAAYFKIRDYEKSLSDIDYVTELNGKNSYFLYYHRALLNDLLDTKDTSRICSDITRAINAKGSDISIRNLDLNYVDSTDLWDVNYLDMLKLRVRYCDCLMPSYTKLDKELIEKTLPNTRYKKLPGQ